jgi:hypothetical protein
MTRFPKIDSRLRKSIMMIESGTPDLEYIKRTLELMITVSGLLVPSYADGRKKKVDDDRNFDR